MARGTFVGNERRDMCGNFDLGALVIAAGMAGEKFGAIDNAHFVRIGEHGEQALHAGVPGLSRCRAPPPLAAARSDSELRMRAASGGTGWRRRHVPARRF
jgi:hypothetical protein